MKKLLCCMAIALAMLPTHAATVVLSDTEKRMVEFIDATNPAAGW